MSDNTNTPIATFSHVYKTYPGGWWNRNRVEALRDVSLTIAPGTVLGLLGPNRSGKTTLLKILLSICQPSEGNVARLGRPTSDRATLGRVGYVHENHAFPRYLTATQLLEYYGKLTLLTDAYIHARIPRLLERVGLADRAQEPIARFSKGMVQRLGIAQAMLNQPELLVLDEPTEGLDHTGRELLQEIVAEQRQAGRAVVLVSHVFSEIERLCDRLAVLYFGRLCYDGWLRELLTEPGATLDTTLPKMYDDFAASGFRG